MSAGATVTRRRPAQAPPSAAAGNLMTPGRPARPTPVGLMSFEALTVAAFSTLHLSGALRIGTADGSAAGIAEALICVTLAGGAWALARSPARGRRPARSAVFFAIAGFVVGLTFTVSSGDVIDMAYHAIMLPVLIATAVMLARPAPRYL